MTYTELAEAMADLCTSAGIPDKYVYYQWPVGLAPEPPYIVYWISSRNDFRADNINYVKIGELIVELYTNNKDPELEEAVEAWFADHDLAPDIMYQYIDDQSMHETMYTMEVILNG